VATCADWGPVAEGCYSGCDMPADVAPDVLAVAQEQAAIMLRHLSGNQYGICTETLRPLGECPVCRRAPCCGAPDRVKVTSGVGPVTEVTEVRVDGVAVDPAMWRFYPSTGLLYRLGEAWPSRDNKAEPVGSLEVDAVIGTVPDAWALAVYAELVCELVKSCTGQKCRLPRNATQVTSQGVTVSLSEVELKHLLPSVAGWVAAVNPLNKRQPAAVWSPDVVSVGGGGCGC
jgi:hypothetical protein